MIENFKAHAFISGSEGFIDIGKLNSLYSFFRKTWEKTWKELDISPKNFCDEFSKFHIQIGFELNGEFVAFMGYRKFNLKKLCDQEQSYFKQVDFPLADYLIKKNITTIASLECMAIEPSFRKSSGLNLSEILIGFSTQYLINEPAHVTLAITRNNRKINEICTMYGAHPIASDLKLHNVNVDIMAFKKDEIKTHSNQEIQKHIEQLLSSVQDNKYDLRLIA